MPSGAVAPLVVPLVSARTFRKDSSLVFQSQSAGLFWAGLATTGMPRTRSYAFPLRERV